MKTALTFGLLVAVSLLAQAHARAERVVSIVATAEVKGTTEPCGCTSDPLGDLARLSTLAKGALLVDAGSLLYDPDTQRSDKAAQSDVKAATLEKFYRERNAEVGLGWGDLVRGENKVRLARQAANVQGAFVRAPAVHVLGDVKVGVFGVVDPALVPSVNASPAAAAAQKAVAQLRQQGAQVIVALLGMTRQKARAILKAVPDISIGVVGADVGDGLDDAETIGESLLVAPADKGQRVAKIELHVIDAAPRSARYAFSLYANAAARTRRSEQLARRVAFLSSQLAAWQKDAHADVAFIAGKKRELADAQAAIAQLKQPAAPPPSGNYAVYTLEPVRRAIARDSAVTKELIAMEVQIGQLNVAASAKEPPPAPEPGKPTYVGRAACEKCHKSETAFWKKTIHANAWNTLKDVHKQYDYDCTSCHVTGWQKPGGTTMATVEKMGLVDVQCETCHGPASKHVAEEGLEDPKTLTLNPPVTFCRDNCHTPEHSDTFQYVPYLRDVVGKGHGAALRASLGDGITGHELRRAALKAAH